MRIDWREHRRTIEVDTGGFEPHEGSEVDPARTEINCVEIGEGPPLLFIHGLSGSWQNWLENIPHFARTHRVIAPDLPGHGSSPMPGWEITIPAFGKLISRLCEQLDAEPAVLVGNSMGGFISAEVTVSQPATVQRLVLVSAAGVSHARMAKAPAETAGRMARAALPIALRYQDRMLRRPRLRRRLVRNLFADPASISPELSWEILHHGVNAPGFVAALGALMGYDILDRLDDVEIPTLIVWGRSDRVVPPADALEYARHLHNSRLEVFDRCGHLPQAERPVRFNRVLEGFLTE